MKINTFFRFLLYTLGFSFCLFLIASAFDILRKKYNFYDSMTVLGGLLLLSLLFSLWGSIWAKRIEYNTKCDVVYIEESLSKMRSIKNKFDIVKEGKTYIVSSSKYYEWFYGKTYIELDNDLIKITGAKCVIKKHFPKLLMQ